MKCKDVLMYGVSLFLAFTGQMLNVNGQTGLGRKSGIKFTENTLPAIIERAKLSKKYIFVDAYADWCGPCRLLKSNTFKDPEVAAFFNAHFINVSLDMEKGEGVSLAEKWGIEQYPTLLILDPEGAVIFRFSGFLKPKELIVFGKRGLGETL